MTESNTTNLKRRAFDQWPVAGPWLRLAAQIVDQILIAMGTGLILTFFFPTKSMSPEWWFLFAFLWPLVSLITSCLCLYFMGTTPGKKAFGLFVQNARPETPLSAWQILSRQALWWLGAFTFGAGWSTVLSRFDRRAWHDLVSETVVVKLQKLETNEAPSAAEKTLGHGWAVVVSLIFFSFLCTMMILQVRRLNGTHFISMASTSSILPALEDASWLTLTGQFEDTALKLENMDDEKLAEQIKYFNQAMKLSKSEKFSFYKEKMQPNEDYLCAKQRTKQTGCQTAQLIAAILGGIESKTVYYEKAYPVFQILYKVEQASLFDEKVKILDDEFKKAIPGSNAQLALKTYLIKIQSQRGDFDKAASYVSPIKLKTSESVVASLVAEKYYEVSCQSTAFSKCDNSSLDFCSENNFWKAWSQGCTQTQESELRDNPAKFGYIWNKIQKNKFSSPEWLNWVTRFDTLNQFESQIFAALDFNAVLHSEEPQLLIEKSKLITVQNPLWGWAQKSAFKEFGSEWLAMVSPQSQNQATTYAMTNKTPVRGIASVKAQKTKLTKKKIKK